LLRSIWLTTHYKGFSTFVKNLDHMLFKWLIVGGAIYFIYRFFIARPAIDQQAPDPSSPAHGQDDDDEGEYIDYEEVDDK
jgi:hypothetical protein